MSVHFFEKRSETNISRPDFSVIPRERSDRRNLLIGSLNLEKVPNLRKDFGEFHVRLRIPAKWTEPQ